MAAIAKGGLELIPVSLSKMTDATVYSSLKQLSYSHAYLKAFGYLGDLFNRRVWASLVSLETASSEDGHSRATFWVAETKHLQLLVKGTGRIGKSTFEAASSGFEVHLHVPVHISLA